MKIANNCLLILVGIIIVTIYSCDTTCPTCTEDSLPVISTSVITEVTVTTAICGGSVTDEGASNVIERGVCWSTSPNPTVSDGRTSDGIGKGAFTSNLTKLLPNTKYYVKAYCINSEGTAYGNILSFTTLDGVVDADGNVYQTVKIGTQTWMAENLHTTKFRNGDPVPYIHDDYQWGSLTTSAAYCDYNHEAANVEKFGRLYNWYAVTDSRNIAPVGWHVPTDYEWVTLIEFLGGENVAGGKMKTIGTSIWTSPNTNATNSSNFSALPAGGRNNGNGFFQGLYGFAVFWSSTEYVSTASWYVQLIYNQESISHTFTYKPSGFSVRLIKD